MSTKPMFEEEDFQDMSDKDSAEIANSRITQLQSELEINSNLLLQVTDERDNLADTLINYEAELTKKDAEIAALKIELVEWMDSLEAERAKVQQLEAQIAHRHILGKAYEVSQESINKLAGELDDERAEVAKVLEMEKINYASTETELHKDEYFRGLQNGIAVVCACLEDREPVLINAIKESGDE